MKKKSLTSYREERHLSIPELAKKVGVSVRTVYYWESDKEYIRSTKVGTIIKLCKVLRIKIDDLI